ncbi:gliding motility protein GldB-related protein [Neolewinella aurantiaca]|uniref:gliding motility protein GldB-related protein n=1 Tax=Neolewinella aurantiaca TaxID=2602767 RepID=UPI0011CA456F|nr:hypothetical protein [Neolewinella aurantiaca]
MNVKLSLLSLLSLLILWSCGEDELPPPDISGLQSPVTLVRFDRGLMALDTADLAADLAELEEEYPDFTDTYLRFILPIRRGDFSPEEQNLMLKAFLTFPLITEVDSIIQQRFSAETLEEQRAAFEQALRYYRYYLPEAERPDTLLTFFSQFEVAAALYGENDIAVGLEFFLGPDYNYQQVDPRETIFSAYLARTYTPAHMTAKLMRTLIQEEVPSPHGGRLIDHLVYEGKKLYLLEKVLPYTPDSIIHEVSAEQMDWLINSEIAIYAHLQKEKMLYSTDATMIKKMTLPAPSSQGMPAESPGGAVNFLGKRIVEDYVKANPKVTMPELLALTDGQAILSGARYKPK